MLQPPVLYTGLSGMEADAAGGEWDMISFKCMLSFVESSR